MNRRAAWLLSAGPPVLAAIPASLRVAEETIFYPPPVPLSALAAFGNWVLAAFGAAACGFLLPRRPSARLLAAVWAFIYGAVAYWAALVGIRSLLDAAS